MTARPPFEPASPAERAALAPAIGDPRTWPAASWPDPQPLPEGLAPVAPFDYAMLPDRLRPWVQDVAERMQSPPDFVAVPMVAALGNLIGRRCAIRPQAFSDWQELPNLWGCIVGRPGMMKSPAMMAALAPVVRLEARALEEWTAAQGQWRAERVQFVPLLGPVTIGLVVILTAAASDDPWKALYVAIFLVALRIIHDYVTYPRIVRGGIQLHPLAIILSVLAGEQVAGIPGVFISIPIVAIVTVFYRHILEHQGRRSLFSHWFEDEGSAAEETE